MSAHRIIQIIAPNCKVVEILWDPMNAFVRLATFYITLLAIVYIKITIHKNLM